MFLKANNKKKIYLDHAATTYLHEKVVKAMVPYWQKEFGNPSSLYTDGVGGKFAVEDSRAKIAKIINARNNEIVFTAGGTESVNLAVFGVARNYSGSGKAHIICSQIEHHAVLESFKALAAEGLEITYLPVNEFGFVSTADLQRALRPNTILVSIMYANNEIGTIQRITELSRIIKKSNSKIIFHTDACQATGALPLDVNKLGVDLMTLNGSKAYGPKQIGLLYVRQGVKLKPLIYGGGQEGGLRSGTENVPAIVGFATALKLAEKNRIKESKRLRELRNYFIKKISIKIPNLLLNGPEIKNDSEKNPERLPNNINFSVVGCEGEALLLYLDAHGIEISTGSACASTSLDPSHVIKALGRTEADARSAIRISLGKVNTKKDLDFVIKTMPGIVSTLRSVEQFRV
ncbi:MAG: cysteine desulfurase NifS [Candidatus Doudnabacteria bacterium]